MKRRRSSREDQVHRGVKRPYHLPEDVDGALRNVANIAGSIPRPPSGMKKNSKKRGHHKKETLVSSCVKCEKKVTTENVWESYSLCDECRIDSTVLDENLNSVIVHGDDFHHVVSSNEKEPEDFCQRCWNHGLRIFVVHPQKECNFEGCNCDKCEGTEPDAIENEASNKTLSSSVFTLEPARNDQWSPISNSSGRDYLDSPCLSESQYRKAQLSPISDRSFTCRAISSSLRNQSPTLFDRLSPESSHVQSPVICEPERCASDSETRERYLTSNFSEVFRDSSQRKKLKVRHRSYSQSSNSIFSGRKKRSRSRESDCSLKKQKDSSLPNKPDIAQDNDNGPEERHDTIRAKRSRSRSPKRNLGRSRARRSKSPRRRSRSRRRPSYKSRHSRSRSRDKIRMKYRRSRSRSKDETSVSCVPKIVEKGIHRKDKQKAENSKPTLSFSLEEVDSEDSLDELIRSGRFCTLCLNHGQRELFSPFHRTSCQYRYCCCPGCLITVLTIRGNYEEVSKFMADPDTIANAILEAEKQRHFGRTRLCLYCKNHGVLSSYNTKHFCNFRKCCCKKCLTTVIYLRSRVNAYETFQFDKFVGTRDKLSDVCEHCKNHGIITQLNIRHIRYCPRIACKCPKCSRTQSKRQSEGRQKEHKQILIKDLSTLNPGVDCGSESQAVSVFCRSPDEDETPRQPPVSDGLEGETPNEIADNEKCSDNEPNTIAFDERKVSDSLQGERPIKLQSDDRGSSNLEDLCHISFQGKEADTNPGYPQDKSVSDNQKKSPSEGWGGNSGFVCDEVDDYDFFNIEPRLLSPQNEDALTNIQSKCISSNSDVYEVIDMDLVNSSSSPESTEDHMQTEKRRVLNEALEKIMKHTDVPVGQMHYSKSVTALLSPETCTELGIKIRSEERITPSDPRRRIDGASRTETAKSKSVSDPICWAIKPIEADNSFSKEATSILSKCQNSTSKPILGVVRSTPTFRKRLIPISLGNELKTDIAVKENQRTVKSKFSNFDSLVVQANSKIEEIKDYMDELSSKSEKKIKSAKELREKQQFNLNPCAAPKCASPGIKFSVNTEVFVSSAVPNKCSSEDHRLRGIDVQRTSATQMEIKCVVSESLNAERTSVPVNVTTTPSEERGSFPQNTSILSEESVAAISAFIKEAKEDDSCPSSRRSSIEQKDAESSSDEIEKLIAVLGEYDEDVTVVLQSAGISSEEINPGSTQELPPVVTSASENLAVSTGIEGFNAHIIQPEESDKRQIQVTRRRGSCNLKTSRKIGRTRTAIKETESDDVVRPTSGRFCTVCRNHGVKAEWRGHKNKCQFRNCTCDACHSTILKRRSAADTTELYRQLRDKVVDSEDTAAETTESEGSALSAAEDEPETQSIAASPSQLQPTCGLCERCGKHGVVTIVINNKRHRETCKYRECECTRCNPLQSALAQLSVLEGRRRTQDRAGSADKKLMRRLKRTLRDSYNEVRRHLEQIESPSSGEQLESPSSGEQIESPSSSDSESPGAETPSLSVSSGADEVAYPRGSSMNNVADQEPLSGGSDLDPQSSGLTDLATTFPTEMATTCPSVELGEIQTAFPSSEYAEIQTSFPSTENAETINACPSAENPEMATTCPSAEPSEMATVGPSAEPSEMTTVCPSAEPSEMATACPSAEPSGMTTVCPSAEQLLVNCEPLMCSSLVDQGTPSFSEHVPPCHSAEPDPPCSSVLEDEPLTESSSSCVEDVALLPCLASADQPSPSVFPSEPASDLNVYETPSDIAIEEQSLSCAQVAGLTLIDRAMENVVQENTANHNDTSPARSDGSTSTITVSNDSGMGAESPGEENAEHGFGCSETIGQPEELLSGKTSPGIVGWAPYAEMEVDREVPIGATAARESVSAKSIPIENEVYYPLHSDADNAPCNSPSVDCGGAGDPARTVTVGTDVAVSSSPGDRFPTRVDPTNTEEDLHAAFSSDSPWHVSMESSANIVDVSISAGSTCVPSVPTDFSISRLLTNESVPTDSSISAGGRPKETDSSSCDGDRSKDTHAAVSSRCDARPSPAPTAANVSPWRKDAPISLRQSPRISVPSDGEDSDDDGRLFIASDVESDGERAECETTETPVPPAPGEGGLNIANNKNTKTRCCMKCRRHGILVPFKGHKNLCPFKMCNCKLCVKAQQKLCHRRGSRSSSDDARSTDLLRPILPANPPPENLVSIFLPQNPLPQAPLCRTTNPAPAYPPLANPAPLNLVFVPPSPPPQASSCLPANPPPENPGHLAPIFLPPNPPLQAPIGLPENPPPENPPPLVPIPANYPLANPGRPNLLARGGEDSLWQGHCEDLVDYALNEWAKTMFGEEILNDTGLNVCLDERKDKSAESLNAIQNLCDEILNCSAYLRNNGLLSSHWAQPEVDDTSLSAFEHEAVVRPVRGEDLQDFSLVPDQYERSNDTVSLGPLTPDLVPEVKLEQPWETPAPAQQVPQVPAQEASQFVCGDCGLSLSSRPQLAKHRLHNHAGAVSSSCQLCPAVSWSPLQYEVHQALAHDPPYFRCGRCELCFPSQSLLSAHTFTAHPELEPRPFLCPRCPSTWTCPSALSSHVRAEHRTERLFPCEVCGSRYDSPAGLVAHHRRKHHFSDGLGASPALRCPVCIYAFPTREILDLHLFQEHSGQQPFGCPCCERVFKTAKALLIHVRAHRSERPFLCRDCTRGFPSLRDLQAHACACRHMVVTSRGPHTCRVCAAAFRDSLSLADHEDTVHMGLLPMGRLTHLMSLVSELPVASQDGSGDAPCIDLTET